MNWYSKIIKKSDNDFKIFYHGTLRIYVPKIMKQGLLVTEGWGGANTRGVYLSKNQEGALYWAKIAYQKWAGEKIEADRFDRNYGKLQDKLLVLLEVKIPDSHFNNLKADMEQADDIDFEIKDDDWEQSLQHIGDVRYQETIPPEWIKVLN